MNIPDKIEAFYKRNFSSLADDKKFHFASRLSAWSSDDFSRQYLTSADNIHRNGNLDLISKDLEDMIKRPPDAKINAAKTRQPYFDKYPDLRGLMLALFRTRHLLTIYGYDARQTLTNLYPLENMRALSDALQQDHEALKTLSTYAINLIYLVDDILYPIDSRELNVSRFYEIGKSYETNDAEQTQLMIYFYTHCIIGSSNFYTRHLPNDTLSIYKQMITDLEKIVSSQFDIVNLDNKFELLVCAKIANIESTLEEHVYEEAEQSFSKDGDFVVDTINQFRQSNKTSFGDSEHRNVLFILSNKTYKPVESK